MKKVIAIFAALALGAAALSGCRSVEREVGEDGYLTITASEEKELVAKARNIILNDKNELSGKEQRDFVRFTEPEVRISYRDNCYGRAIITWHMEEARKRCRVVFTGLLNSNDPDELYFRYSIVRETAPQTIENDGSQFQQSDINFTRKEWLELKSK